MDDRAFTKLLDFLARVPAVRPSVGHGADDQGLWWVKFEIDTGHALAWHVVQEFGHVLNYLSLDERLPTMFTALPERRARRLSVLGHREPRPGLPPRNVRGMA